MKNLLVKTKPAYPIFISRFDLDHAAHHIKSLAKEKHLFIITNTTVKKLYAKKMAAAFKKSFQLVWLTIPDGEKYKNLKTVEEILTTLSQKGAQRQSILLALGGGVVGDIAGFVAATYMRGIDYVQVPTTLVAQVDSSVGGKTGVDLVTGKNLAGAFYQPRAVFILTDFLKTLPDRELRCGLAEVIKYGVIWDQKLFDDIHHKMRLIFERDANTLADIIYRCVAIKAEVVAKDEKESSLRAILNFGHTLGHAIETLGRYNKFKHGEAVAIGMGFAAVLSHKLELCPVSVPTVVTHVLVQAGLPTLMPSYTTSDYLKAMTSDKKTSGKNIKFVLVKKIGEVVLQELQPSVILRKTKDLLAKC